MKYLKFMFIITALAFLTFTSANASIVWEDYGFNYAVEQNGARIYVSPDSSRINSVPVIASGLPVTKSKQMGADGDPINSSVSSTSMPDTTALGLQLKAGAGGDDLTNDDGVKNGVKMYTYLETSTASGGVQSPFGVEADGTYTQEVISYFVSRFHVTSPGAYNLTGQLTDGVINDTSFFLQNTSGGRVPAIVEYGWEGGLTLYEGIKDSQGNILGQGVMAKISLDDLWASAGTEFDVLVNLRTQDIDGNSIFYDLKPSIDLDSMVMNFNSMAEEWGPEIPADGLGFLGTEENPLTIEATLSEVASAPVPIPGTAVLLFSGIAGLIGFRNRRRA